MFTIHIEVTDVTGRTWRGDSGVVTHQQREALEAMFGKGIAKLAAITVVVNGRDIHFHPAHVIAATVITEES